MQTNSSWPFAKRLQILTAQAIPSIRWNRIFRQLVSAAVFFIPLIAYVWTAAPTIYNLDSAELSIAAATGGLMRATGYPLYLLLGRFWTQLPIGDVGFRMNLFSAFNGALAIWLVYRIMRRLEVGIPAALGAVGLMAAAPFFWSLSLVAEVYTLHAVLMAVLIHLLLRWSERPSVFSLGLVTFWIGISLGHHLATVLLVPGAAFFVTAHLRKKIFMPQNVLAAVGGLLVGVSIYLYIPYLYSHSPAFNYAGSYDAFLHFQAVNLASPDGLWWLVTGKSFASQMFAYRGAALLQEVVWYAGHLGRAFLYVGIGPGVLGLWVLLRKDRTLGGMLLLMFGASAFFYIDYMVVDKETMFIPTYLVWSVWAGFGYQALYDRITGNDPYWLRPALSGAIAGAVIAAVLITGPKVGLNGDWSTRRVGQDILAVVRTDGVVFGWWDSIPPVQYLQLVEGERPDVQAVNRFLISGENLYEFARREALYRPVYIDSIPSDWDQTFRAVDVGPLYRLELLEKELPDGKQNFAR